MKTQFVALNLHPIYVSASDSIRSRFLLTRFKNKYIIHLITKKGRVGFVFIYISFISDSAYRIVFGLNYMVLQALEKL